MKTEYSSGLWSERESSKLIWGKGDVKKSAFFRATDKIEDVPSGYHPMIRKAGKNPSDFCSVGNEIVARILIPEIEACIAKAQEKENQKQDQEKTEFNSAVKSGEAFRTAEITEQYGSELHWGRHSKLGEGYAEWVIFGYAGSPRIKVEEKAINKIIAGRKSDGSFPGCSNVVWIITQKEWEQIVVLSAEIEEEKKNVQQRFEQEKTKDIQNKIDSGFCFSCETWCHGDCGHYNNNPSEMHRKNLAQAICEQNYGIQED